MCCCKRGTNSPASRFDLGMCAGGFAGDGSMVCKSLQRTGGVSGTPADVLFVFFDLRGLL
ncbi:hypothetical protein CA54_01730 [Symmachiella macrocystis]|uniref:Uncharacterized protein n=1 Tax=Symmachiella macrocystis TaxID=2527985 RepID=A0A5C6BJ50_9PLAN|nr:hypothetical protein CA54_01730 [Symmachiella macrocystis]